MSAEIYDHAETLSISWNKKYNRLDILVRFVYLDQCYCYNDMVTIKVETRNSISVMWKFWNLFPLQRSKNEL